MISDAAVARRPVVERISSQAPAQWAIPLVIAAAAYAIGHPYLGIIGDSTLYLGRALADLSPGGVGRDIVFMLDGQSRFSLFSRLADPLVAALGAERAGIVIAAMASVCVFAATIVLARALTESRRLTIAVALVAAAMPATYGAGIFRFAETAAVPRPFAEAAVMVSMAALIAGRPVAAALFLAAAALVHPIMAMAGVGTVLVLLAWRRDARTSLAVVSAMVVVAGLIVALGAAGVPLLDRLVVHVDADWLGMLAARSPYLFPSRWPASDFAAPIVQATTIALAVRDTHPKTRRVLVAVAVSAFAQLAAALVFGDALHGLLAIQVQEWRALWLLAVVAMVCLPYVASQLWRGSAQDRVVLALLGLAWLSPLGLAGSLAVCVLSLVLRARSGLFPIENRHAIWALAAVAAVALVTTAIAIGGWASLVSRGPRDEAAAFVLALRSDLLVAPVWLATAVWLLAEPRRFGPSWLGRAMPGVATIGLAALAVVAARTWDERGSAAIWGNQDGFAATGDVPGAPSSELFVVGGLSSSWFALGRPQYFSPEQAASIVFSRPLAMAWRRRADALRALDLVPRNVLRPWDPLTADDHVVVTAEKISALCARNDAPAAVIVPDRDDAPAPKLSGASVWNAPAPLPILEKYQPPQWHVIRGWVIEPCRSRRSQAELAKTDAR